MGFKDFVFRGNIIQLAVAVIIGAAFGSVVTALTKAFITPILGIFGGGQPKFADMYFEVNGSHFLYGQFVDALIAFLITALVLYYLVVVPSDWILSKMNKKVESSTTSCSECCSKIEKKARRCPMCTSVVSSVPAPEVNGEGKVVDVLAV